MFNALVKIQKWSKRRAFSRNTHSRAEKVQCFTWWLAVSETLTSSEPERTAYQLVPISPCRYTTAQNAKWIDSAVKSQDSQDKHLLVYFLWLVSSSRIGAFCACMVACAWVCGYVCYVWIYGMTYTWCLFPGTHSSHRDRSAVAWQGGTSQKLSHASDGP